MVKENKGNAISIRDFLNLGGKFRDERLMKTGIRRFTSNEKEIDILKKYYFLLVNTDYLREEVYELFIGQKTHKEVVEEYRVHENYMRNIVHLEVKRVFKELTEDPYAIVRYGYYKEEQGLREEIMERISIILDSLLENVSIKKTRDLLDFLVINIENHANSYNEYEGHIDQEVLQETIDRIKYLSKPYLERMFGGVDKRVLGFIVYLLTTNNNRLSERDEIIKEDICSELFIPRG